MKHLRVILAILIALAVTGVGVPSASAADPITGSVLVQTTLGYHDETTGTWVPGDTEPVAGVVISAHAPAKAGGPAPKPFVSAVTGPDGTFSLDIGSGPVCIQVQAPAEWQSGWVLEAVTDPTYPRTGLYGEAPEACSLMTGAWLGEITLISAEAWGYVVDQNGDPISGAVVKYLPYDFSGRTFSAMTDANGYYLINGLDYEEMEVKVSARKYLAGWVNYQGVGVATWGEASAHGTGAIDTPDHQIQMTLR